MIETSRLAYRRRMGKLRRKLSKAGADGIAITHLPNILYLSGFSGSSGVLLVEPRSATLFTDTRYAIQAREEVAIARIRISPGPLLRTAGERLQKLSRPRMAFEPARLSVAEHALLRRSAGPGIRWVRSEGMVEELRAVKDDGEIAKIRKAAFLASEVLKEVLPLVKPGVRELELAAEIEYRMRHKGASRASFETIVASGARSALPHASPTEKPLKKNELVVLDLGAILSHYSSDLTRTVYLGRAPKKIRGWYEAVREARTAALDALGEGVTAGEVDAAARCVLERYGLGKHFIHSTGHGLGLEVHEMPRLARGQKTSLQAGNVVTLEPGIYVKGVGGIRMEDDVALLAGRVEVLTRAPLDFLEL